uniref:3'-5' exonuclease domain-containing protein n=1 Tax=Panagrolaimus superbus TaxID=310955 RepID=A0A914YWA7_9BILA
MAADDLPNLIKKEVQKFSINIIRRGFYVYYYGIVDELNQLYISESREVFEQRARDVLKGPDNGFSYKSKFIDIFANDPQYGLYWAKFLNIKRAKLPDFVQELIEKPVVLIQVAVEFLQRWIALIDVQALPKDLPEWKKFFEHLFGNTTDSVWFAFETDFACLCKTFPFLSSMFSYYAKVICLKKFVEEILQNPKAKEAVFANQKLESLSLAHIAETFTGISLKKELQQSDWAKRPLTDEQKLYAATDAAILLEIVEKIEELLRK